MRCNTNPIIVKLWMLAVMLPAAFSMDVKSLLGEKSEELNKIKTGVIQRNPDLVGWMERARHRLGTHQNATEGDLEQVREMLREAQRGVYEFVTGPNFNITCLFVIEKAVQLVEPVLAIFPLKEIKELYTIVQHDRELSNMVLEGKQDLREIMRADEDLIRMYITYGTMGLFQSV